MSALDYTLQESLGCPKCDLDSLDIVWLKLFIIFFFEQGSTAPQRIAPFPCNPTILTLTIYDFHFANIFSFFPLGSMIKNRFYDIFYVCLNRVLLEILLKHSSDMPQICLATYWKENNVCFGMNNIIFQFFNTANERRILF